MSIELGHLGGVPGTEHCVYFANLVECCSTVEHLMPPAITDEVRYRLLAYLADNPSASQREVAAQMGVSLGKVNYCLKALVARGWIKMRRFSESRSKMSYTYVLTPRGIEEKIAVTYRFLKLKMGEYDALSVEIERLHDQLRRTGETGLPSLED